MQSSTLRAVPTVEEFDRGLKAVLEPYGGEIDGSLAKVKREQAVAEYLFESRWTQDQIAKQIGKSVSWVSYRLRFGSFLVYLSNSTRVEFVGQLTEGFFRKLWEVTDKDASESTRFDAVIKMLQEGYKPEPKRSGGGSKSKKSDLPDGDQEEESDTTEGNQEKKSTKKKPPSIDLVRAREILRPLVESDTPFVLKELVKEHSISEDIFRNAKYMEEGRLEGLKEAEERGTSHVDKASLSKTAQQKLDALEKRLRAGITVEVRRGVQEGVTKFVNENIIPAYQKDLDDLEMLKRRGKPFTYDEYRMVLRALHPDNKNEAVRGDVFNIVKRKEVLLRSAAPNEPSGIPPLPKTKAEWEALRTKKK